MITGLAFTSVVFVLVFVAMVKMGCGCHTNVVDAYIPLRV